MPNAFELLAGFLDRTEPEVAGHARPEPPAEVKRQLRHFARGELPAVEQAGLIAQLNENRHWIPFLAEEVKALRSPQPAGSRSR